MFLSETLDVKFSGLVDQLLSDQVISGAERDIVSAEKTSFRANEKLLAIISRKSPQQFQLFLNALVNCGQRHVRNIIMEQPGLYRTSLNVAVMETWEQFRGYELGMALQLHSRVILFINQSKSINQSVKLINQSINPSVSQIDV